MNAMQRDKIEEAVENLIKAIRDGFKGKTNPYSYQRINNIAKARMELHYALEEATDKEE